MNGKRSQRDAVNPANFQQLAFLRHCSCAGFVHVSVMRVMTSVRHIADKETNVANDKSDMDLTIRDDFEGVCTRFCRREIGQHFGIYLRDFFCIAR